MISCEPCSNLGEGALLKVWGYIWPFSFPSLPTQANEPFIRGCQSGILSLSN